MDNIIDINDPLYISPEQQEGIRKFREEQAEIVKRVQDKWLIDHPMDTPYIIIKKQNRYKVKAREQPPAPRPEPEVADEQKLEEILTPSKENDQFNQEWLKHLELQKQKQLLTPPHETQPKQKPKPDSKRVRRRKGDNGQIKMF